ncbi:MAG: flagellar hook-basal body complex protein [Lachnospiraceae bacterium]|uniref:Flagellar hook-basal body complex protein n=1 Tax=Candidatus Weimeria bifida TaxID=2599074 RepID=A0A6N7J1P5_9FIRM|nr:flagellar hook-basal body complex protein [Candidatus Weimeria bifida]RRF96429.1 MAG: flagellar hook-basal body complex protein [Lachnospiraceae bacterium]
MMRSLWTAATGMKSQQTAVDTIANNLANVNTVGFKQKNTEFKSLLYQNIQTRTTSANGQTKPTQAQVGLGTRVAATNTSFATGIQQSSDNPAACFIAGNGFFSVEGVDGNTYYTRDGDFNWTIDNDGRRILTNNQGLRILDSRGRRITLPDGVSVDKVSIDTDGNIGYIDANGAWHLTGQRIGLFQFSNMDGLDEAGGNLYRATAASGAAINEATTNLNIVKSQIKQGYIEGSNVSMADQMVDLIIAQRAYEMNSKAITTSDSMLETANNLRR